MCDYSLQAIKSRAAEKNDKLISSAFIGTNSHGFAGVDDPGTAVCVLPGTELAFEQDIVLSAGSFVYGTLDIGTVPHRTAIFRQIDKHIERVHHDALELPDGKIVLLTCLEPGQKCTVLQLPAAPKTKAEADEQRRLEVVG